MTVSFRGCCIEESRVSEKFDAVSPKISEIYDSCVTLWV